MLVLGISYQNWWRITIGVKEKIQKRCATSTTARQYWYWCSTRDKADLGGPHALQLGIKVMGEGGRYQTQGLDCDEAYATIKSGNFEGGCSVFN